MPNTEKLRLADLHALQLDQFADVAFDDLTRAAADTFGVSMSSITIMGADGQWLKSSVGMSAGEATGATAFGTLAMKTPGELTVIEDATLDPRFATTLPTEGGLRFYVAAPLTLSTGRSIGVICVQDTEPHQVDPHRLEQLKFMAAQVVATLEKRKTEREALARGEQLTG